MTLSIHIKDRRKILIVIAVLCLCHNLYANEVLTIEGLSFPLNSFNDRKDFKELSQRSLDGFGAYRRAGHKHAGLDIYAHFSEKVLSIGKGKVKAIYGEFPYKTVIIEHETQNKKIVYSAYTHVEDIQVSIEQKVDVTTIIGRACSEEEFKKSEFYANHIHLEIRKSMERYKGISIRCYSLDDLHKYFYDPSAVFKNGL
jgi:murein DD-endopeptidase MepM/ murein hydrolase activator NlpD